MGQAISRHNSFLRKEAFHKVKIDYGTGWMVGKEAMMGVSCRIDVVYVFRNNGGSFSNLLVLTPYSQYTS
jgi:hypothetical protein